MSAVLGQAIALAVHEGYVVTARRAAPPCVEALVGMAVCAATVVDRVDVLRGKCLSTGLAGGEEPVTGKADADQDAGCDREESGPHERGRGLSS